jgi:hypothetical protein
MSCIETGCLCPKEQRSEEVPCLEEQVCCLLSLPSSKSLQSIAGGWLSYHNVLKQKDKGMPASLEDRLEAEGRTADVD